MSSQLKLSNINRACLPACLCNHAIKVAWGLACSVQFAEGNMEDSALLEKVKRAIELNEMAKLKGLFRLALENRQDKAIELSHRALRNYEVHVEQTSIPMQDREQEILEYQKNKLTKEAYEQLLERYNNGESTTQLAIRYGIKRIFIQSDYFNIVA